MKRIFIARFVEEHSNIIIMLSLIQRNFIPRNRLDPNQGWHSRPDDPETGTSGPRIFIQTWIKEVTPRPITAEERKYLEKNFMVNISDPEGRQRNQNPPSTTGSCCSPTHHITSQPMVAQSQNHVGGEQVTYVQQQTSNQYQQVHSSNKNPGTN